MHFIPSKGYSIAPDPSELGLNVLDVCKSRKGKIREVTTEGLAPIIIYKLFENIVEYLKIFHKKATFFTVPAGQLNRELATEGLAPSQYALPEIHSGCWVASSGQVGNNLGQLGGNKEVVGGN